ncbi:MULTISPECIES: LacI family DNA-binding transcriptional regulator [Microbacterium]|uniref:LacI family transcriptional regulator n=1 Tax=Microbacterium sufflavum TaxID=2851649 RepID=A0ABY4IE41_9MICO|nr:MULTISPECIES: LacI family DNA-binding transcriptional regulator [Microbacterium]MBN6191127.1 LacI family DNA-binding transcriptional regulator [Aneurinibacillus sp. BA2021]UPL10839.1 LacI family transcriptional regulator [Microbacterium sufflavum]
MPDSPPARGRVRLIDVAELAGVTKSVASRILSRDETLNVRPSTRARVLDAAERLQYSPHAGARALAASTTGALSLLIPDLTNPVYARIARGAYQRAHDLGYVVLLAEDNEETDARADFTDLVDAGRVDGLLIASARQDHPLIESGRLAAIPHVFVNRTVPDSGRNVTVDLELASRVAYEYLHGLGHRAVAHISGPGGLSPARDRERGFLEAAARSHAPIPHVVHADFSEAGGYAAVEEILRERPDITAIYAGTLPQSIGALKSLQVLGRRVPHEVSLLSYDDLPMAAYLTPALTTLELPLQELGTAAVDELVQQLRGGPPRDVTLGSHIRIVERDSVTSIS